MLGALFPFAVMYLIGAIDESVEGSTNSALSAVSGFLELLYWITVAPIALATKGLAALTAFNGLPFLAIFWSLVAYTVTRFLRRKTPIG